MTDDKESVEESMQSVLGSGVKLNHLVLYDIMKCRRRPPASFQDPSDFEGAVIYAHISKKGIFPEQLNLVDAKRHLIEFHDASKHFAWYHCCTRATFVSMLRSQNLEESFTSILTTDAQRTFIQTLSGGGVIIVLSLLQIDYDGTSNSCIKSDTLYLYASNEKIITYEKIILASDAFSQVNHVMDDSDDRCRLEMEDFDNVRGMAYKDVCNEVIKKSQWYEYVVMRLDMKTHASFVNTLLNTNGNLLVYEMISGMFAMFLQVFQFYEQRYRSIHESLLIKRPDMSIPDQTYYDDIVDRVEFLEAGSSLMHNLTERCTKSLTNQWTEFETMFPPIYSDHLREDIGYVYFVVEQLESSLKSLHQRVNDVSARRNDQIRTSFSLTSFVFLPLSFITAGFGMNFEADFFQYLITNKNGVAGVMMLMATVALVCLFVIWTKGWTDILNDNCIYGHLVTQLKRIHRVKEKKKVDENEYAEMWKQVKKTVGRFVKVNILGKKLVHKKKRVFVFN